jgi:hypothetical protein
MQHLPPSLAIPDFSHAETLFLAIMMATNLTQPRQPLLQPMSIPGQANSNNVGLLRTMPALNLFSAATRTTVKWTSFLLSQWVTQAREAKSKHWDIPFDLPLCQPQAQYEKNSTTYDIDGNRTSHGDDSCLNTEECLDDLISIEGEQQFHHQTHIRGHLPLETGANAGTEVDLDCLRDLQNLYEQAHSRSATEECLDSLRNDTDNLGNDYRNMALSDVRLASLMSDVEMQPAAQPSTFNIQHNPPLPPGQKLANLAAVYVHGVFQRRRQLLKQSQAYETRSRDPQPVRYVRELRTLWPTVSEQQQQVVSAPAQQMTANTTNNDPINEIFESPGEATAPQFRSQETVNYGLSHSAYLTNRPAHDDQFAATWPCSLGDLG